MTTRKPRPPKQSAVDADLASTMLRKLGIQTPLPQSSDEAVHAALIKLWKLRKRPPTVAEMADEAKLLASTANHALGRLVAAGRALRPRKGVYVPVID